jgi:hypothetical protein
MPVWMTAPTEGVGSLARAGAVLLLVMMTSIFLPGVILQIGAPPTPSNRSLLLDCDGSALRALSVGLRGGACRH